MELRKNKYQKDIFYNGIIIILLALVTFVISLSLKSNPFSEFLPGHDSSMFQYFGYAMDHGKVMYTEIFDHKGPMIFIINYIGVLLTTKHLEGIYIIEYLSLFLYFFFSYKTLRIWLPRILSFISVIPQGIILIKYLEGGNLTEEFALPFLAISIYIFAKYFSNPKKTTYWEIIILGISCAIVFSLRANMIILWLVFCFIIFLKLLIDKEYKSLWKYTLFFSIGLLLVFLPIGIYLFLNDAFEAAIFQSLIFNFMYLDASANHTESRMQLYTLLKDDYIILIATVFLAYAVGTWKKLNKDERYLYLAILLFSIGSFMTSILSGRAYRHYLMAMVPTITLPLALIIKSISGRISKTSLSVILLFLTFLSYYPNLEYNFNEILVINTPVSQIKAGELSTQEQEIIKNENYTNNIYTTVDVIKENTTENDTIYAHRRAGNLYLLSDRLSSVKYFNLPAVNINDNPTVGKDFLSEVTQSDTELIIFSSKFHNQEKIGINQEFFDYVLENYALIFDQNGHYVYKNVR